MSDLGQKTKVKLELRYVCTVIVSLGRPHVVSITSLASTIIEKSTFQEYCH